MRGNETVPVRLTLMLCNVAGMVDLVALPLWVGSLMQSRGLAAQQAGFLVTCYILAIFFSSLFFSARLGRMNGRFAATIGYLVGGLSFLGLTQLDAIGPMVALHVTGGLGIGCGLSFTCGAMGRTSNPHRMFALAGFGLGMFGIGFFAFMPGEIAAYGAPVLFAVFAGLMLAAAAVASLLFPRVERLPVADAPFAIRPGTRVLAFLGVACLATTQAMIFAFLERSGVDRGFAPQAIGLMLAAGGVLNLTAPVAASILDRRISHFTVAIAVLPIHAAFGAVAILSPGFPLFAVCGDLFVWMIIFGHTFMFSLIARLDPTGRTAASTPAMLMIGSAAGPILGGTLVDAFGYASLAAAGAVIASCGMACFVAVKRGAGRAADDGRLAASALSAAL